MRIAYITSSLEGSGGPLPIPAVTRVLRNAGAEVEVFALTLRDGRALPGLLADGLKVHVREGGNADHKAAYRWLKDKINDFQPELLWTSVARASILGILLSRKFDIPIVCWQHNSHLKLSRLLPYYLLRKTPAMWIGDSDLVTKLTQKRFNIPSEKMATWPLFAADVNAPQATPWQPGQTLQLGSLGRLHPQKRYDILIDALSLLKKQGFVPPVPFEVSIAGEGKRKEELIQKAESTGCTEIKFIGFADEPKNFLSQLHLYLQPSKLEGFCIAVHEAMQAGLPVIASSVGQIPYTVEEGKSGWLIPHNDANSLADSLAYALNNPDKLADMGQNARQRVIQLYSKDVFQQAGESILNHLHQRGIV